MTSATSSPGRAAAGGPATALPPVLARVALVGAAALCAGLGASTWVTAPLALVAFLLVVEAVTARWARGGLDGLLVAVGGSLAAAALAGVLLDLLPGGLDRTSWAVTAGAAEAAVVVLGRVGRPALTFRPFDASPFLAGTALVAIGLVLATSAYTHSTEAPLALSVTPGATSSSAAATLRVTSSTASGPLSLVEGSGAAATVLVGDFSVADHRPFTTTVVVAPGARVTVHLVAGSGGRGPEVRTVILDRS